MSRAIHRLNALQVKELLNNPKAKAGRYADGNGLYLQIDNSGGKSWIFVYQARSGRRRIMGLGPARTIKLERARRKADEKRRILDDGKDPIDERKGRSAGIMTFGQVADKCFTEIEAGWRSDNHRTIWQRSLTLYAKPLLGKPIGEIVTDDVDKVLRPLWLSKPETAIRLRGRLERVLDWAKAKGHRTGENPAAWKGNLKHSLPTQPRKRQRVKHHPALPYAEIPTFMAKLRASEEVGARVLEFLILTAARSAEALGARWTEIDFDQKLWTMPGERMKAGETHVVPLCPRAIELLKAQFALRSSAFVFPGFKDARPLDRGPMRKVLRQLAGDTSTSIHGLRATFRTWAAERTNLPREIAEKALAHTVGDETERSYQRGELLDKRRKLMDAWAGYCARPPAADNVIAIKGKAS